MNIKQSCGIKTVSRLLLAYILMLPSLCRALPVDYSVNRQSGAIESISVDGDTTGMNWIMRPDGSQYPWIGPSDGWGLGYFTAGGNEYRWADATDVAEDGSATYRCGEIDVIVNRKNSDDGLVENYVFTNRGDSSATLTDMGILTPFNDNYPDAATCVNSRCHAHVWPGGNSAYVYALRMGGYGPHVGLVLTEGSISDYEIWHRGNDKGNSQTRGVIALCPDDMTLAPGKSASLEWKIFTHSGKDDFCKKAAALGCDILSASDYLVTPGQNVAIDNMGGNAATVTIPQTEGFYRHDISYGEHRNTFVDFYVVNDKDALIADRLRFILDHQRMTDPEDARYGAFMIYDCEGDSIYPNDTPNCNPVDRDEGAERTGMGVFAAKYCLARQSKDTRLISALEDYARFLRTKLQTEDYKTFSSVDKTNRNRAYNYAWVAEFYFLMHQIAGDPQYARDGYGTLRSMFDQFGHGFYSIGIPILLSERSLKEAGMQSEWETLKDDYIRLAATFMKNGLNYPLSEVNYEQSIVAPVVQFLAQMYLLTKNPEYLEHIKVQMPVMEAFNGFQPSVNLNDIAIRHWDGYWFGKSEMYGDVFPHYWSTITASAFHFYSLCTGDESWQRRAENIVDNNLCLFMPDGKASCAFLYPRRVDGRPAKFHDAYANDQDWALAYYLQVKENVW